MLSLPVSLLSKLEYDRYKHYRYCSRNSTSGNTDLGRNVTELHLLTCNYLMAEVYLLYDVSEHTAGNIRTVIDTSESGRRTNGRMGVKVILFGHIINAA